MEQNAECGGDESGEDNHIITPLENHGDSFYISGAPRDKLQAVDIGQCFPFHVADIAELLGGQCQKGNGGVLLLQ
ncbi:hypothetical protein D3C81_2241120 [compost metagenome]